jgi:hypothetical protein
MAKEKDKAGEGLPEPNDETPKLETLEPEGPCGGTPCRGGLGME